MSLEKDIAQGNIGNVGSYEVDFKGGKLVAKASAAPAPGLSAGAFIEVDSDVVVDLIKVKAFDPIKAKVPGTLDDALIDLIFAQIKAALK